MKEKIKEIVERNYDPDIDEYDFKSIGEEVVELIKAKTYYKLGVVEDPFNTLQDD